MIAVIVIITTIITTIVVVMISNIKQQIIDQHEIKYSKSINSNKRNAMKNGNINIGFYFQQWKSNCHVIVHNEVK